MDARARMASLIKKQQFRNALQGLHFNEELRTALSDLNAFTEDQIERMFLDKQTKLDRIKLIVKFLGESVGTATHRGSLRKFVDALAGPVFGHVAEELTKIINANNLQCFLMDFCNCEKGCTTRKCPCRKSSQDCTEICHLSSKQPCQNGGTVSGNLTPEQVQGNSSVPTFAADGDQAPSSSASTSSAASDISSSQPSGDIRFVLKLYNGKMKRKCPGCNLDLTSPAVPKFVLGHQEPRGRWEGRRRIVEYDTVHYHCRFECVGPDVIVTSSGKAAAALTATDVVNMGRDLRKDMLHLMPSVAND